MASQKAVSILGHARNTGQSLLAVLIDPDQTSAEEVDELIQLAASHPVDLFLVGGSLLTGDNYHTIVSHLAQRVTQPVVLFPGNHHHFNNEADAILFLSLLSGRNPEYLIGQHIAAAPYLTRSSLEVIPTGYILIDGGVPTTVSYMSNTMPIPADKPDIATSTAIAGELLGMQTIYLDAGSGAVQPVPVETVHKVRRQIDRPLIVGGGIRTAEEASARCEAGADLIVVGSAIEQEPGLLVDMSRAVHGKSKIDT